MKTMEGQFGEKIQSLRDQQHFDIRQIISLLELDTTQLSEIKKGLRQLKREQIQTIAHILKADEDVLLSL